jgi:hypothetical protein
VKEVFLPVNRSRLGAVDLRGALPYEPGAVWRTAEDGSTSLHPARRYPDGRVEIVESEMSDGVPPPESSGDLPTGKVFLENWQLHRGDDGDGNDGWYIGPDGEHPRPVRAWVSEGWRGIDEPEETARLASAAPAMVRVLLRCEWGDACPECGVPRGAYCDEATHESGMPYDVPGTERHDPDGCQLDAALTAAGFPDQTSRDAARCAIHEADSP